MAAMTQQRRDLLDALSDEFLHNYRHGRTFLAVDGIDGAPQAEFADDLAQRLGRGGHAVFRASIDAFHRPRADRYLRGQDDPRGYFEDSYDYDQFRRVLIEPFRMGGSTGFTTAAFDWRRDSQVELEWQTGPQDATLVVDGVFLNRPELRGIWNYSIWLDVDQQAADARLLESEGRVSARYRGGQALYQAQADPRDAATAVVDVNDPASPQRIFLDRC